MVEAVEPVGTQLQRNLILGQRLLRLDETPAAYRPASRAPEYRLRPGQPCPAGRRRRAYFLARLPVYPRQRLPRLRISPRSICVPVPLGQIGVLAFLDLVNQRVIPGKIGSRLFRLAQMPVGDGARPISPASRPREANRPPAQAPPPTSSPASPARRRPHICCDSTGPSPPCDDSPSPASRRSVSAARVVWSRTHFARSSWPLCR